MPHALSPVAPVAASPARPWIVALATLALLAVWLIPAAHRDLMETDEGRYAEISREMMVSGDWVTPRLDGLKYFEKPPLQYWATAAVFEIAGPSTFTARLYTALCGLLTLLAVWRTATRLWGRQAGDYAGLATASMVWMLGGSQVPTLDMSLTLYLSLALCAFLIGQSQTTAAPMRRWWMLGVWAAISAAVLTKGLVALLIPGVTLIVYSLLHRDLTMLRRMEWLRGLALLAVLTAPWFVLVSVRNPEFPHFFFIHEHLERYLTTEHHRTGAPWYFVPLLLLGALPWTPLLPFAIRQAWRDTSPQRQSLHLALIWSVFVFCFFSLSGSKLPFYILPMFPALGLLLGPALTQISDRSLSRFITAIAGFWGFVAVVAPTVLCLMKGSDSMPHEVAVKFAFWTGLGAAAITAGAALARLAMRYQQRVWAIALLAIACIVGLQVMVFGFQEFGDSRSTRSLADAIRSRIDADTQLFVVDAYYQTLPFYLERTMTVVEFSGELDMGQDLEPEKWIPRIEAFKTRWIAAPDALAVAPVAIADRLRSEGLPMEIVATTAKRVAFRKPATDSLNPSQ